MSARVVANTLQCGFWLQFILKFVFLFFILKPDLGFLVSALNILPSSPFLSSHFLTFFYRFHFFLSCGCYFIFSAWARSGLLSFDASYRLLHLRASVMVPPPGFSPQARWRREETFPYVSGMFPVKKVPPELAGLPSPTPCLQILPESSLETRSAFLG